MQGYNELMNLLKIFDCTKTNVCNRLPLKNTRNKKCNEEAKSSFWISLSFA